MIRLFINEIEYTDYLLSCDSSEMFEDGIIIGNSVSKQLNISLDNESKVFNDLLNNVIVLQDDDTLFGNFLVYNKPERMTATIDLTLYDSMALTNVPYDTKLDYENNVITIADQLNEIATITGVSIERGDLPNFVLNTQVFTYDNTVSCRAYLGWIGELGCCNAFSLPTASISFVSLNIVERKPLSETDVEKFETVEQYTVSKVKYDNGSIVPIEKGNDEGKTIYISQDNIYISVSEEEQSNNAQMIVDYIYSKINGLSFMIANDFKVVEINGLKLGNLIAYENEFVFMATQIDTTYYNAEYNIQYLYSKFPTENKDKVTNRFDLTTRFRRLTSEFDQEKLKWSVTAKEVEGQNEKIGQLELSNEEIKLSLKSVEEEIKNIDTTLYHAEISNDGTSITRDISTVTLTAKLMNASSEVTTSATSFNWKRVSSDTTADTTWNNAHKGRKSVVITSDDLDKNANFYCNVTAPEWSGKTSSVTINDETKIPQLSSSFLDVTGVQLVQTLNTDGTYSPSWTQMKPIITPSVIDGVLDVPLTECTIEYKRVVNGVEQALISGETVANGILTISKNVMSKTQSSITYISYITYKEVSIKLFASFSLNIVGAEGGKGDAGVGIKSVIDEYYVSTSKIDHVGGSWSSAKPIWSTGKYLWKRTKNTKTDNTVSYTTAYCDNSWEAVNEIEIGGRNLLLKSGIPMTTTRYNIQDYYFGSVAPQHADEVTITMKAILGEGKTQFGIYNSGGSISVTAFVPGEFKNGIVQKTVKWRVGTASNDYLRVYHMDSTTIAESTVEWIRLDFGNKVPLTWIPSPEDQKQDLIDTEVRITESYNSAIEETNKNIRLFVAESIEATGDWQSALNSLKNEVVLTKDATEFLKTSSQVIKDLQSGKVDINEIKEWARFDGATLELGASNSQYKTKLTTTELGFYQGNTKVAWISNNELHVTSISAEKSVKIGAFIFEDEGAYGFTLKKAGG